MRPIGAGRGKIGRARIKSYLRRIMPETRHRPARMIPRRNEDDALRFLFAEQFDGELRIFPCRAGLGFQFNRIRRHARRHQPPPVYFVIAQPADDDARRGVFLEKFRRAFRPFVRTTAQYHNHVGLHRPAVHAQKRLRKNNRGHDQQQQQNEKARRGSFEQFFHARKELHQTAGFGQRWILTTEVEQQRRQGTAQRSRNPVTQTSKSAVSRVSKPADHTTAGVLPTWKSATQQVWKPALRNPAGRGLRTAQSKIRNPRPETRNTHPYNGPKFRQAR